MSVRRFEVAFITIVAALAGLAVVATQASAVNGQVPTPVVTGPIEVTPTSYPFLATDIDLEKYGYVEQEFFVAGDAYRYDTSGDIDQTASKILTGGPNSDGTYPFNTRIVVRRPADKSKANGVVVVEWNNVTSTQDVEFNWFGDPFYLLKNGYTFVAVTAQNVGVNALKGFDRPRYRDLTVTGNDTVPTTGGADRDALSYDVFGAVVKAIKGGGLGVDLELDAEKVIASGESQSCGRLATHYNKIEPLHNAIDGYLLTVCGSRLRTDRPDDKAVRVLSELENQIPRSEAEYPDTEAIRHWEVAAGSHLPRMAWDNLADLLNRDFTPLTVECERFPLSLVEWPFTVNRAIAGLSDWMSGGDAPPIAPRGQYVPNPEYDPELPTVQPSLFDADGENLPTIPERDQFGIAMGGIRYPAVTVPTATNTGINARAEGAEAFSLFCGLLGSSTAFTQSTLGRLYRDHADYVRKYSRAADEFLKTDFILAEDVSRLKRIAREYPRLRPTAPRLTGRSGKGNRPRLAWSGTEAASTTFQIQRARVKGKKKLRWSNVKSKVRSRKVTLPRQPKGVWRYRVRSSSVIPANNIAPAERVTTPFSVPSKAVKIRK